MTIIGIDPGKTGAIAHMQYEKMNNISAGFNVIKMPETIEQFDSFIKSLVNSGPYLIFIEKVFMMQSDANIPGKAIQIQKLFNHVSELKTSLRLAGINYHEVVPKTWQKRYLHFKTDKKERKKRFAIIARERYPHKKFNQTMGDAVLIMDYAKGQYIHGEV